MSNPFHDPGAAKLLSKVREDITDLRGDVHKLLTYTTRYTLPKGARELAGTARQGLASGRTYATQHLRSLGASPPRQAFGLLAGVAIIGLLAAGVYAFAKSDCCRSSARRIEDEEEAEELGI